MTSFRIVEYILIAAAGLILGIAVTLWLAPNSGPAANPVEVHSADDGHNHGESEATDDVADWCAEHRVPESQCTQCSPVLIAEFKESGDWCGPHDLPESHCRLCNPDLHFPNEPVERGGASLAVGDWCAEHRVPESQCTKCSPALVAKFKESGDWCPEHGLPESQCRLCNPQIRFENEPLEVHEPALPRPSVLFTGSDPACTKTEAVIRFASAETAERSGIAVEPAISAATSGQEIDAPAELIFDETRTYAVTMSLPATVVRWRAELGQQLRGGDPIAELESPEMAALQAEYLEALTETRFDALEAARADSLHEASLISSAEHQRIVSEFEITKTRRNGLAGQLRAAGLSDEQISRLETTGVGSRWTLMAPQAGNLLDRRAPLGLMQASGATIVLLGDPTALWIEGHLRQSDAGAIRVGQRAFFAADGGSLERTPAEIFWVAPYVDSDSRTVSVRARLLEIDSSVKAYRYGRLIVASAGSSETVIVAKNAVHWEGCCNVVFVREDAARYRPRKVEIERGDRTHYRVASGLNAGEMVVVKGGYLLKTELMKSSLGAGCCGH